MNKRPVFAALMLVATAGVASAVLFAQANQRSMYVSVVDEAGVPVSTLEPADIVVREDNVAREILHIEPATDPMQVEILVDNSQAARDYINDIRTALPPFVDALAVPTASGRHNEVGLVAFGDRPTILAEPSIDSAQVRKGIDRVFSLSSSGSYLLDAIIDVCKGFKKREAMRPVIVTLTTEGPEFSNRHYDLVLTPLRDSGAAFNVFVIGPMSSDMSDEARNRAVVLDRGPRETGGRFEQLLTSMALAPKLAQLSSELKHQFKVTYARPQSLIPPEHVTVTASRPGFVARGTLVKEPQNRP
jgi:hypothetical protein